MKILRPNGVQYSGRSGSVVHQRNGVRRNFSMPPAFRTGDQIAHTAQFPYLGTIWWNLTPTERATWDNAQGFGHTHWILFNYINTSRLNIGLPVTRTCPPISTIGSGLWGLISNADDLTVTMYAAPPIHVAYEIFASRPQKPSKMTMNIHTPKYIGYAKRTGASSYETSAGIIAGSGAAPAIEVSGAYLARWGYLPDTVAKPITFFVVRGVDGQTGQWIMHDQITRGVNS